MKAKELMLMDWVINPAYKDKRKIDGVYYDKELHCRVATDGRFPQEYFEPIPLIKEILEKNPQVEELGYWDERSNLFRLYAMPCINQWSVDRLQKSLRLCELSDLADNFKV